MAIPMSASDNDKQFTWRYHDNISWHSTGTVGANNVFIRGTGDHTPPKGNLLKNTLELLNWLMMSV